MRIFDELHRPVGNRDVARALRLLKASEPDFTPDAEIAALINAGGADPAPHLTVLEEGRQ